MSKPMEYFRCFAQAFWDSPELWLPIERFRLYVQGLQERHALRHQRRILFKLDEVVLYAPCFCGGKYCLPVHDTLAYGNLAEAGFGGGVLHPVLAVHGEEAAGVPMEIGDGIIALLERGDLKLQAGGGGIECGDHHVVDRL